MNVEHDMDDLKKIHYDLVEERDKLLIEINRLHRALQDNAAKDNDQNRLINEHKEQLIALEDKLVQEKNANIKESKLRAQIELKLQTTMVVLEKTNIDFELQKTLFYDQKKEFEKLKVYVRKLEEDKVQLQKDKEILHVKIDNANRESDKYVATYDTFIHDRKNYINQLKQKNNEILQLRQEYDNEQKQKDHINKNLQSIRNQIGKLVQEREDLYVDKIKLEAEKKLYKKQADENLEQLNKLIREREHLNRTCQQLVVNERKQIEEKKNLEQTNIVLEQDIINYQKLLKEQEKTFVHIEKERNRYLNEACRLQYEIIKIMDDIKQREPALFEQRQRIKELENNLKDLEKLNATLTVDCNFHLKTSTTYSERIDDMKRKLENTTHQLNQVKADVHDREQYLAQKQDEYENINREKKQIMFTVERLKMEMKKKKEIHKGQQIEHEHLNKYLSKIIEHHDQLFVQLQKAIAERNILGAQIVRRNDELALLYEKLKIQQSTLTYGELQYEARLEDIRILRLELKKFSHEKSILLDKLSKTDELKRELFHSERELTRERTRCRQLEEELENPMNLHRWRQLEGSDPSKFELVQKIQFLQKRLIRKTEEVTQKELFIQEKERLYTILKINLARQPSEELAKQVSTYQGALLTTTRQLKSLICEVKMHESQIDELKHEIHKLHRQLTEQRQKFSIRKKKENPIETCQISASNDIISPETLRTVHIKTINIK